MTIRTKSQIVADDVAALFRARNPLLWVVTREESRTEKYLVEAAFSAGYVARTWDCSQGVADITGKVEVAGAGADDVLSLISQRSTDTRTAQRCVWILRDLGPWIGNNPLGIVTQRTLRNLARTLPGVPLNQAQAIVILSAGGDVPPELAAHATVIDWPLPDRDEIADVLDACIQSLPDSIRGKAINGSRDASIDAAVGLSGEEAAACYAKSLVQRRCIDPAVVASEKKRVIARERVLEWYDPLPGGLSLVGGLENLKAWLKVRETAFSPAARAYGLPAPKGAFLVGVPGCGKSLFAKAAATAWGCPLLRFDFGALKSKFVGESESNLRRAFATIAAIGKCVVWFDEIEKALQGATSGSADGGVAADALGTFLSWMQERQGESFVIATANDVTALPPELLRKGRFDEIWFVDLPNLDERAAVLASALRQHKRDPLKVDVDLATLARKTEGYTGSEIAALVPDALFTAFADGAREITTADLIKATDGLVPLSQTAAEKIKALRAWKKGRARDASIQPVEDTSASSERIIDFA